MSLMSHSPCPWPLPRSTPGPAWPTSSPFLTSQDSPPPPTPLPPWCTFVPVWIFHIAVAAGAWCRDWALFVQTHVGTAVCRPLVCSVPWHAYGCCRPPACLSAGGTVWTHLTGADNAPTRACCPLLITLQDTKTPDSSVGLLTDLSTMGLKHCDIVV